MANARLQRSPCRVVVSCRMPDLGAARASVDKQSMREFLAMVGTASLNDHFGGSTSPRPSSSSSVPADMPVVTNIAGNRRLVRPRWGRARHARDELSRALPELPAGRARRPCTLARIGSGRRCPRPRQIADPGWNRMFRRGRSPLIPNSRSRIPIWCSSWKEVGPHFPSGNACARAPARRACGPARACRETQDSRP